MSVLRVITHRKQSMLDITITMYLTIFLGTYYTLDTVLGTEDKTVKQLGGVAFATTELRV